MGVLQRFILAIRAPDGRRPVNHRLVMNGIFGIARILAPWRDLPEEFGKWSSVYVFHPAFSFETHRPHGKRPA